MFLTAAATFALMVWVFLWSIGVKGFDAFLVFVLILFLAVTVRAILPNLPGHRTD